MGGGGFSMEDDRVLDDYILGLTGRDRPKVGFLGTAGGDAAAYIEKFHGALSDRAETSNLRLFSQPSDEPREWVDGEPAGGVAGRSGACLEDGDRVGG